MFRAEYERGRLLSLASPTRSSSWLPSYQRRSRPRPPPIAPAPLPTLPHAQKDMPWAQDPSETANSDLYHSLHPITQADHARVRQQH